MKINKLYISNMLMLALMASCNSGDNKAEKNGTETSGGGLFGGANSKDKAVEIVDFNNKLVKADNTHSNYIQHFLSNLDQTDRYVQNVLTNPDGLNIYPITAVVPTINNLDGIVYPDGFSSEFKPLVDNMDASFKALKEIDKEIKAYTSAEDYKEDKGAKMKDFRTRSEAEIKKNRDALTSIYDKLIPQVEKAEEVVLADHPFKDQVMRSKKIMNEVQRITDGAFSINDVNAFNGTFKKAYADIEKLYNENKSDNLPSEGKSKESSFTRFNDDVNSFLGKMRIVQRELDASKTPELSNIESLDQSAQNVLSSYNSFVN
ncbi:hypothetical protein ACS126_11635 [Sphingobacterium lactis]|uniref:hypothetical protein n=1 Tax=Sphingobacterium lactis TaxID=797291 RepID=UPI003EC90309